MYLLIILPRKTDVVHTAAALIDLFFTWNLVRQARELYVSFFSGFGGYVCVYTCARVSALCVTSFNLAMVPLRCGVLMFIYFSTFDYKSFASVFLDVTFFADTYEHLSQTAHRCIYVWLSCLGNKLLYLSCIEAKDARGCVCGSLFTIGITYAYV